MAGTKMREYGKLARCIAEPPPEPVGDPPRFLQKPQISQRGGDILIECSAKSASRVSATWTKDGTAVREGARIRCEIRSKAAEEQLVILTISVRKQNHFYHQQQFLLFHNLSSSLDSRKSLNAVVIHNLVDSIPQLISDHISTIQMIRMINWPIWVMLTSLKHKGLIKWLQGTLKLQSHATIK